MWTDEWYDEIRKGDKVFYHPNKLELRSNWDLNENFFIEK